jgi:hypothetical protein
MEVSRHITTTDTLDLKKKYHQSAGGKPVGFWTSDGTWEDYIKYRYRRSVVYAYDITCDMSEVLVIKTVKGLKKLRKKYEISEGSIDWKKVAKDYTAIVFPNYEKLKSRLDRKDLIWGCLDWYERLDCNCCCIFDLSIIEKIRIIKDYKMTYDDDEDD